VARLCRAGWPGFHGPRVLLPLVAGMAWCWSRGMRQGADAVPGGHDVSGPGQVPWMRSRRRRPPRVSRAAACRMRRKVFGSALAGVPSRASSLSQASRVAAVRAAAGLELEGGREQPRQSRAGSVLPSCLRHVMLDAGVASLGL
jgi:hypothetical protein